MIIGRVDPVDQILYQTERYHHSTFGYDIPVFDIVLNGNHTVVTELDIFERVGRGIAHDVYVPIKVQNGKLIYNEEESDILGGKIRVEFIKSYRDNPKINAIAVIKETLDDVPLLEPMPQEPDEDQGTQEEEEEPVIRTRNKSGPRTPDPYESVDSSFLLQSLPICAAIGAFIPLLFCLCKL
uniref:Malectin domain-containing protein n=1 Tax=Trichogramma kaykai TaxID=54128 RepID=A0ABD2VVF1_9HYME